MCRMIAAPLGVPGRLLIEPFARMARGQNALSEMNPSYGVWTHGQGWGAVYEDNGRLEILRSVGACWDDPLIETLRDRKVFLLHARKATAGDVVLDNTHPFDYELGGHRWSYCHNGTVRDPLMTPTTLRKASSTDSEKVFHSLRSFVADDRVLVGLQTIYGGIRDFTSLNSFLLGPSAFWAVSLYGENPDYYALSLSAGPQGPIFASEALPEFAEGRTVVANGSILRVDRATGEIEMSSLTPGFE